MLKKRRGEEIKIALKLKGGFEEIKPQQMRHSGHQPYEKR